MGATTFMIASKGKTAAAAFDAAVERAKWEHGHGGYTGTIAEKHSFVAIKDTLDQVLAKMRAATPEPYYGETPEQARKRLDEVVAKLVQRRDGPPKPSPAKLAAILADALIDMDDPRVRDKWGPAGCIAVGEGEWIFFGWASE